MTDWRLVALTVTGRGRDAFRHDGLFGRLAAGDWRLGLPRQDHVLPAHLNGREQCLQRLAPAQRLREEKRRRGVNDVEAHAAEQTARLTGGQHGRPTGDLSLIHI